uniref:Uncharacterized protein n=1 Tax=Solibacter usitatus (strain Ellin6076) TaxID=234267 RepID=Q020N8_SOLUE
MRVRAMHVLPYEDELYEDRSTAVILNVQQQCIFCTIFSLVCHVNEQIKAREVRIALDYRFGLFVLELREFPDSLQEFFHVANPFPAQSLQYFAFDLFHFLRSPPAPGSYPPISWHRDCQSPTAHNLTYERDFDPDL